MNPKEGFTNSANPIDWRRFAVSAFVLVSCSLGILTGQQPAETLPGFAPNSVLESRGIDNVNLYSGDPGVVVPLGPEYPLGPGSSWGMRAYYSAKIWKFDDGCLGDERYRHALVTGYPTLGVGWTLSLGAVGPGDVGEYFSTYYFSPDGGRHGAEVGGVGTSGLTADGSRLRIARTSLGYTVEFPDGSVHYFEQRFKAPRPVVGSSHDFTDREWGTVPSERYGLKRIEGAYENGSGVRPTLLTVKYMNEADFTSPQAWQVDYVDLALVPGAPAGSRRIDFTWTTEAVGGSSPPDPTWQVLDFVTFPVSGGRTLKVDFTFQDAVFNRNPYDLSGGIQGCESGLAALVPKLTKITLSDPGGTPSFSAQDYNLTYFASTPGVPDLRNGLLTRVELPAKGTINYEYSPTVIGLPDEGPEVEGCAAGMAPSPQEPLITPGPHQKYYDKSAAVTRRTAFDPFTNLTSDTFYERKQYAPRIPPVSGDPDQFKITRRVLVRAPSGNGASQVVTRHLFHTEIESEGSSGIELQRRTYAPGQTECTTPVRTLVFCYGAPDAPIPPSIRCGYKDGATQLQYDIGFPTQQAEITWYGANPVTRNGTCDTQTSEKCKGTTRTGYDTNAREYGTETLYSNLTIPGLSSRTTTTAWSAVIIGLPTPRWILDRFTSKTLADAGGGSPSSVSTSFTFEMNRAFLEKTVQSGGANGTLTVNFTKGTAAGSEGAPIQQQIVGSSGLTGTFTDAQTFENGLAATVTRSPFTWKSLNVDREDRTGLVTGSQDPNGKQTSYAYDALGRLTSITPPTGAGDGEWPTTGCFFNASSTEPALLIVKKGTANACVKNDPTVDAGTFAAYQYDGFGRVVREARRFPDLFGPSGSSTYFSRRETRYDAAGHAAYTSEWAACPRQTAPTTLATTDVSNCLVPVPLPANPGTGTTSSNFDAFGRPERITGADGASTTIDRTDGAILYSDTREKVTRKVGATALDADTVTRRDVLGRIISVTEPPVGGAADATDYVYNVQDKLTKVTQGAQVRDFTYDAFGFLRSEEHPELSDIGGGVTADTTYVGFNALGNPGPKPRTVQRIASPTMRREELRRRPRAGWSFPAIAMTARRPA